jgi:hypothetical protein
MCFKCIFSGLAHVIQRLNLNHMTQLFKPIIRGFDGDEIIKLICIRFLVIKRKSSRLRLN